ncbi:LamG-like jellyroll fold domain-containing protein, partial [Verrucomicrobiales bacterium BCK34]|nr:LamG-like jellyroll fold domain-containing protein [Verrucomicrobiales bacterium BCK34]
MNKTTSSRRKRWFFARSMARAYQEWLEKRTRSGKKSVKAKARPLFAEALEPRVLFSGSPVPVEESPNEDQSGAEAVAQTSEAFDDGIDAVSRFSFEDGVDTDFSDGDLERLAREAVARWEASGLTEEQIEALESINYVVTDLEGSALAYAEGNSVYIDRDAAGLDWFVDDTEWLDEEFVEIGGILRAASGADIDGLAAGGIDMLSVLMHEQGHILGLLDEYEVGVRDSSMFGEYDEGERRLPGDGQAGGADALSLEGRHFATASTSAGGISIFTDSDGLTDGGDSASGNITTADFTHNFDTTVVNDAAAHSQGADGGITLSEGHHLVIYSSRFDSSSGFNRSEIQSQLTINGGDTAYGWSQGYIRRGGADEETITAGGAIIDAAASDVIKLESFRTDNNGAGVIREPGATGIQLIKLDDSWDYFRVAGVDATNVLSAGAGTEGFANGTNVIYSGTAEELDGGFSYDSATGKVTFNGDGHYLVFANTYVENSSSSLRTSVDQRFTLDGAVVSGTTSSVFLRGSGVDSSNEGAVSMGTVVSASAGQELAVQIMKSEDNVGINVVGARTGLTIVKLPDTGSYLNLDDTTRQNFNDANAVTWNTQTEVDTATFDVSNAGSTGEVSVNAGGDYLFFSSLYTDTALGNSQRSVPSQLWDVKRSGVVETLEYGQTARYNRHSPVTDSGGFSPSSGNWTGAVVSGLNAGDSVTLKTNPLGSTPSMAADDNGLRGISLSSILSDDPIVYNSGTLAAVGGQSTILSSLKLRTVDGNTNAAGLTYTLIANPTLGTLKLNGTPLDAGGPNTFTQEDVDNGLVTFEGNGGVIDSETISLTVGDGSTSVAAGFDVSVAFGMGADPLTLTMDLVNNEIDITRTLTGDPLSSISTVGLTEFLVLGSVDDNELTIDLAGGHFTVPIAFDGDTQSGSDKIRVVDSGGGTYGNLAFNYENPTNGSIDIDGSTLVNYVNQEAIESDLVATNVTLNYSDIPDTVDVTDAGTGTTSSDSTAGVLTTFKTPSSLVINGGGGDDVFNIADIYATNTDVYGNDGADTLNLTDAHGATFDFFGGADADAVNIDDTHTTGRTYALMENGGASDNETVVVNNAHSGSLQISANAGSDTITVNDTNTVGATLIYGDNNDDTITINDAYSEGGAGSLTVDGGANNDEITLIAVAAGTTVVLLGGDSSDTISIQSVSVDSSVSASGGAGIDVINLANGDLDTIKESVSLDSDGSADLLNIDDSSAAGGRLITLDGGSISSDGVEVATHTNFKEIDIKTGSGDDTVDLGNSTVGGDLTLSDSGDNLTLSATDATISGELRVNTDITIDASILTATGDQYFGGDVTLDQDTTLAAGNVTFAGKVDANVDADEESLTVESAGTTNFQDSVGSTGALESLTTDASGSTVFGGIVSKGAELNFNASEDDGANAVWENSAEPGSDSNAKLNLDDDVAYTSVAPGDTSTIGITGAYDFPGNPAALAGAYTGADNAAHNTDIDTRLGAQLVDNSNTPLGSGSTLNGAGGVVDATFEIWIKPDSVNPSDRQYLFETGGSGSGLYLQTNGNLEFILNGFGSTQTLRYNLNTDPMSLLGAGATTGFIQVVGTFELTSGGNTSKLYINGVQVASGLGATDFDGGDAAAIATKGGSNSGGIGADTQATPFDGQIAIYRQYNGQALTAKEAKSNYMAVAGSADAISVTTTGDQSFGDDVTTNASTTFNAANVNFSDTIDLTETTMTVNVSGDTGAAAGAIVAKLGNGAFIKQGVGTFSLDAVNTFSGDTQVLAGTLRGSGAVAGDLVIEGATLDPGGSEPGTLAAATVTLDSASVFHVDLDGAAPGEGAGNHDQLVVSGNVDLNGAGTDAATLDVSLSYLPVIGQTFKIIDGGGTLDGAFRNSDGATLNEGDVFESNGVRYSISYTGGDVTLTVLKPSTVYVSAAWAGGGADPGTSGDIILDADGGAGGDQSGLFGYNAFATITEALSLVDTGGTVIVNAGNYDEVLVLSDGKALEITGEDAGGTVTISSLAADSGTSVVIEELSTLIVGTDNSTTNIAAVLSGSGDLVKEGTGAITFSGAASTATGDTTVNAGVLVWGANDALPGGSVTVNSGATVDLTALTTSSANSNRDYYVAGIGAAGQGGALVNRSGDIVGASIINDFVLTDHATVNFAVRTDVGSGGTIDFDSYTLTKSGVGYMDLWRGADSPNGSLVVNGGKVYAESGNLNLSMITVNSGAAYGMHANSGASFTTTAAITLNDGSALVVDSGYADGTDNPGTAVYEGTVAVNGTVSFETNGVSSSNAKHGNLTVNSVISGLGIIELDGDAGRVIALNGENTFGGTVEMIDEGTFVVGNELALQNATLDMLSSTVGALDFGTLTAATLGALTGDNDISLENGSSSAVALSVGNNDSNSTYSGGLSGSGALLKIGDGDLTLDGNNSFTGTTVISEGTLIVDGELGDVANGIPSGKVSIADMATLTGSGTLLAAIEGVAGSNIVTSGDLVLGDPGSDAFDMSGNIMVNTNDTLTLHDSSLAALGAGTVVNGTLVAANGVTMSGADRLSGTGTVEADINVNTGGITPGDSIGDAGVLTIKGDLDLASGSEVRIDINGSATAGADFDQIVVEGSVDIDGAILDLSNSTLSSPVAPGTEIIIISNSGNGAVTGTPAFFADLPEGSAVTIGDQVFEISYVGGTDSNDVTLTAAGPVETAVTISGTSLVITDSNDGSDTNDNLKLTISDGGYTLTETTGTKAIGIDVAGAERRSAYEVYIPFASLTGQNVINFNSLDGVDILTLDFASFSGTALSQKIIFAGGAGSGDTLNINNGTFTTVTHTMLNASSGEIDLNGGSIEVDYSGLEPVLFNSGTVTDFVFNLPSGTADSATLSQAPGGMLMLNGATFESTTFAPPSGSITINGQTGDSLTLSTSLDLTASDTDLIVNVETIALNGGNIDTGAGNQAYNGTTALGADTTLDGGDISFFGTVDGTNTGTESLTVNVSGTALFGGDVGAGTTLEFLTTGGAGEVRFAERSLVREAEFFYTFDSVTGVVVEDLSGNGRDATYAGDPVFASGIIKDGVAQDGVGDYGVVTGYKGVGGTDSRTMAAWIKVPTSGTNTNDGGILSWGDDAGGEKWVWRLNGDDLRVEMANGGIESRGVDVTDGEWHFVAVVFEGTTHQDVTFYVDGVELTETTSGASVNTDTGVQGAEVFIGTDRVTSSATGGERDFNGELDEVGVWNRALTAAEIAAMAMPSLAVKTAGNQTYANVVSMAAEVNFESGGDITFREDIAQTVDGSAVSGDVSFDAVNVEFDKAVNLGTGNHWSLDVSGSDSVVSGVISGDGSMQKRGLGTLTLVEDNTFTGGFFLGQGNSSNGGFVVIEKDNAFGTGLLTSLGSRLVAANNVVIPNEVYITNGGLRIGGANDIEFSGPVGAYGNERTISLHTSDGIEVAFTNTGAGFVMDQDVFLDPGNAVNRIVVSSVISGANNLTKNGNGAVYLSGDNTYTGTTTISAGTLYMSGNHDAASGTAGDYTVASGARLGGTGATDAAVIVSAGGQLMPGPDTGDVTDDFGVGALSLTNASGLSVELEGTGVDEYDQIDVASGGSFTIDGAELNISIPGTPGFSGGDVFKIVDNESGSATVVSNPFTIGGAAAPHGTVFEVPDGGGAGSISYVFTILYNVDGDAADPAGTAGNDVVLVSAGPAETEISIDGDGNLVITDINGAGSNDDLNIDFDGANYTITDPNLALTTGIAGALRPDANTVVIPATSFPGGTIAGILLNTLGNAGATAGDIDQVNFTLSGMATSLDLNGNLVLNGAEVVTVDTGDAIDLGGGDIVFTSDDGSGTNTLSIEGGSLTQFGSIVEDETNGAETNNLVIDDGTFGDGTENITVDNVFINSLDAGAGFVYTRTAGTLQVNNNLQIGGNSGGGSGGLNQTGTAAITVENDLLFGGVAAGGVEGGTYNLFNGSLTVNGDIIEGADAGSLNAAIPSAQLHIDGGTLTMTPGSTIVVQRFAVGESGGSTGSYTAPVNQSITSTGTTSVGASGTGTLNLTNSGVTLTSGNAYVGERTSGNGKVTINGNANAWDVSSFLIIGNSGTGMVDLVDGTLDVDGALTLGAVSGSNGTLVVGDGTTAPTVEISGGNTETALHGTGRITVKSGTFTQEVSNIIVGQEATSNATFEVSGGTVTSNGLIRINHGTGLIDISGGIVNSAETVDVINKAGATSGIINVSGGTLNVATAAAGNGGLFIGNYNEAGVTAELNVSGTGIVNVNGSGSQGGFRIANNGSDSSGAVTLTGSGQINVSGGNTELADNGTGTMTVDGGTFTQSSGNFVVGQGAGSDGTVVFDSGIIDIQTGDLNIANAGVGFFTQNGGTLLAGALQTGNTGAAGVTGTYRLIDGVATLRTGVNNAEDIGNTGFIQIGDGTTNPTMTVAGGNFESALRGNGTVEVRSGTLDITGSNLITGQNAGSVAILTVGGYATPATINASGTGSTGDWNTNSGNGIVSVLSNGTINVGNDMNLGSSTDANSGLELTIDGGTVNVGTGSPGVGNIDYRNGGPKDQINLVSGVLNGNGGSINLQDSADSAFSFAGGTLRNFSNFTNANLTQTGVTSFLEIGAVDAIATMTVNGDYANTGGTIHFDIDGTAGAGVAGGHDQLIVDGTVTLTDAVLDLDFGFNPAAGDVFVLIDNNGTADAVSGTFAGLPDDHIFEVVIGGDTYVFQIDYTTEDGTTAAGANGGNNVVLKSFGIAETGVELVGGKLVITDINSDSNDDLTILDDGTHYVISDSALVLTSGSTELERIDANSYRILKSDVTAGLEVLSANGADTVGSGDTLTLAGPASTEVNFDFGGDATLDVETLNLQANLTGGHALNLTRDGVNVFIHEVAGTTLTTEANPLEIEADITALNADFKITLGNGTAFFNGDNSGLSGTTILRGNSARWALGTDTSLGADGHTVRVGTDAEPQQQWFTAIGDRTIASDLILDTQRFIIRGVTIFGNPSGAITIDGDVELSQSGVSDIFLQRDLTINGIISGTTGLEQQGGLVLTLTNAANSFTGGIDLDNSNGTLVVANAGALGDAGNTITFTRSATIQLNSDMIVPQSVVINSGLTGTFDTNGNDVTLNNSISGQGRLEKVGSGALSITQANTYQGGTTLGAGTIRVAQDTGLGTGVLTIEDGTAITNTVNNNSPVTLANDLVVNGDFTTGELGFAGPLFFDGDVDLGAVDRQITTINSANNGNFAVKINGVISGGGGLTKAGTGFLNLGGLNTFSGGMTLDEGTLVLTDGNGDGLGAGTFTINGGTVASQGFQQPVVDNEVLVGGDFSILSVNPFTFANGIDLGGATRSITSVGNGNKVISGDISNGGVTLSTSAPSSFIFTGTNTYTGGTNVAAGTLLVNGTHDAGAGDYTVAGGAVLGGTGVITTAGTVTVDGILAAGDPAIAGGIGELSVDGDITINSQFLLQVDGANSDTLLVTVPTEEVTLGGASTLVVTDTANPAAGSTIIVIDNAGADAVNGTFSGLAEGATVTDDDGDKYTISYVGIDGNDVVLFTGAAETNVDLSGGVLTISDIANENADALTISYDDGSDEYVIADPNLVLTTTGLVAGQFYRPDAHTVRVSASVVNSIVVNTSNGTPSTIDTVTIDSLPNAATTPAAVPLEVTINAENINLNSDITTGGNQTYNGAVTLAGNVTLTGADITFSSTVDSDTTERSLTTSVSGILTFSGNVGGINALSYIDTGTTGTTRFTGQTYLDNLSTGTGLNLNFDASFDSDTADAILPELSGSTGSGGAPVSSLIASDVVYTSVTGSSFAGITGAYLLPGNTGGAADDVRGLSGLELQINGVDGAPGSLTGAPDFAAATFEFWIKPDDLLGDEVIWETGGGRGTGFAFEDSELVFRVIGDGGVEEIRYDLATDSANANALGGALATDDFIQISGTIDPVSETIELFINGTSVGSFTGDNIGDWDGGDAAGLGTVGGANMGGYGGGAQGFRPFDGQIAAMRLYGGILSQADILQNFNAVLTGGATEITIRTSGDQTFGNDVELGINTVIEANDVTFHKAVDVDPTAAVTGALTVNSTGGGVTTFNGDVGATNALAGVITNADGSVVVNSGSIVSSGPIAFNDEFTATVDIALNGGTVSFGSTSLFNGAADVDAAGDVVFSGSATFNGITSVDAGNATFGDTVDLGGTTVVTAANITADSTIDGNVDLLLNASGVTDLNGAIGGTTALASLVTDAPGRTELNGNVSVDGAGGVVINDLLQITANVVIDSANAAGDVTFARTVDGPFDLIVNTPGGATTFFEGSVGGTAELNSLTTDSAGLTKIGGASVIASGTLTLNFDADNETSATSGVWEGVEGTPGNAESFDLGTGVTFGPANSSYPGITNTYIFAAGNSGMTSESLDSLGGNPTDADATLEFWIRPQAGSGNYLIYETGGSTDGSTLVYDADAGEIVFTADDLDVQLQVRAALAADGEFHQVAIVYDNNGLGGNRDVLRLYVDGVLVDDTDPGTLFDATSRGNTTGVATDSNEIILTTDDTVNSVTVVYVDGPAGGPASIAEAGDTVTVTLDPGVTSAAEVIALIGNGGAGTALSSGGILRAVANGADTGIVVAQAGVSLSLDGDDLPYTAALNDFAGSDSASLGAVNGAFGEGSPLPLSSFVGDIAKFRFYENAIGNSGIASIYDAVVNHIVEVNTTGDQIFGDAVELRSNVEMNAANVTFESTLDSCDANDDRDLTVNTTGAGVTTFGGDVGGNFELGDIITNMDGVTRILADLTVNGDATVFFDSVEIGNDSSGDASVTMTQNGDSDSRVIFGGTVDAVAGATANLVVDAPNNGAIQFAQDVGSSEALATLTTGAAGRTLFQSLPATGEDMLSDASVDIDGDDRWEDESGVSGLDFLLDSGVTRVTGTSGFPGITAAYDFAGGSVDNVGGALLKVADSATDASFQTASGDWTDENVSIEIWFKPDNLTPTPVNGQIIFEDGGGTGLGFFIDNNELRLRKAPGGGNVAYNLNTDPGSLLAGPATDEFIQAIGTYNVSTGTMELFVNGISVGTATPGGNDWSGGDAAALGTRGASNTGGIGGGQSSTESFDGQIGRFQIYRDQIVTESEATGNFASVAGFSHNVEISVTTTGDQTYNGDLYLLADVTMNAEDVVTVQDVDLSKQSLTINVSGESSEAQGEIGGEGTLTKAGVGTFTTTATNTYTGTTSVDAGTLLVNGNHTGGDDYFVSGGALGGTGTVALANGKTVTTSGTGSIAPGNDAVGSLTISNDDTDGATSPNTVNLGGDFDFEIDGNTGVHDLLAVNGTVTLGGTLDLEELTAGTDSVDVGTTITVINNDGSTDLVEGTFAGQLEGSTITDDDGDDYVISYVGNDGNDVVLFAGTPETQVDLTGGVLSITDITSDSVNAVTVVYDEAANTYTISEADIANVIGTSGVTVISRTANSVTISGVGITAIDIDTTDPGSSIVGVNDSVTVTTNGALSVAGEIAITSDDITIGDSD